MEKKQVKADFEARVLRRQGGSIVLSLPPEWCEKAKLRVGSKVVLTRMPKAIVMEWGA